MKYLKRSEINTEKWDDCINSSEKPLIYGISWFLDVATDKKWDALVWGDYDVVMPLPWNRKTGFKQIYTPLTIQQLGLFGKENIDINPKALTKIFNQYFQVNYATNHKKLPIDLEVKQLENLIIPLHKDYEVNYRNYTKTRREALRKGGGVDVKGLSVDIFLMFYEKNIKGDDNISFDFDRIKKVLSVCGKKNCLINYGAFFEGELISVLSGYIYKNRITLVFLANSINSYKKSAYPVLVDYLIKEYANQKSIIDFRGSSVKSIYDFNRRFGAIPEIYYIYNKQNLLFQATKKLVGR